jgi:hypothetical protein
LVGGRLGGLDHEEITSRDRSLLSLDLKGDVMLVDGEERSLSASAVGPLEIDDRGEITDERGTK